MKMESIKVAEIIKGLNEVIQDLSNEVFLQKLTIDGLQRKLDEAEAAKGSEAEGGGNE